MGSVSSRHHAQQENIPRVASGEVYGRCRWAVATLLRAFKVLIEKGEHDVFK